MYVVEVSEAWHMKNGAQPLPYTVKLQWLEYLWDYENLFETGVVRAIEGSL